jgi:hypothetical protein
MLSDGPSRLVSTVQSLAGTPEELQLVDVEVEALDKFTPKSLLRFAKVSRRCRERVCVGHLTTF